MKKQHLNLASSMKSVVFIFLFGIISQNMTAQNNNIKLSMVTKGKVVLSYERALSPKTAVQFNFIQYDRTYKKNWFDNDIKYTNKGFRIGGEYRIYLSNSGEKLNGFYVAPNFTLGQHKLKYKETTDSGLLAAMVFATIDVLGDGKIDNQVRLKAIETFQGEAEIMALGAGAKMGYQKRWKKINLDLGVNFTTNSVLGKTESLSLDNGESRNFNSDIDGYATELFIGIGIAF